MSFDPRNWKEVVVNEGFKIPAGRLQLRLTAPAPLLITTQGNTAIAGYEASYDLKISEASTGLISAPSKVRAFLYAPDFDTSFEPVDDEVYTNIDRMPSETGVIAEVLRATRQLELKKREMLAEMRAIQAEMAAEAAPPVSEPDTFVDDPAQQDTSDTPEEVQDEPS